MDGSSTHFDRVVSPREVVASWLLCCAVLFGGLAVSEARVDAIASPVAGASIPAAEAARDRAAAITTAPFRLGAAFAQRPGAAAAAVLRGAHSS